MSDSEKISAIAALLLTSETQEWNARQNSGWDSSDPEYNYWEGVSDLRDQVAKIIVDGP